MELLPGEPHFQPWKSQSTEVFTSDLVQDVSTKGRRPAIISIDGRSGSGKTTLAKAIAKTVAASVIIHTDDIAWHHSFFDWSELLIEGVLKPLHEGTPVAYRPPAWEARARDGAISVPAETPLLIVEGVGAARQAHMPFVDKVIWLQSDSALARERGLVRDEGDAAFWDEWMAEEIPFLDRDKPWERADRVVAGNSDFNHDLAVEICVSTKTL